MLEAYRRRRAAALEAAAGAGLRTVAPDGTLYMLVDVSAAGLDDLDFALGLLRSHGVSVAPGSVFGPAGRGWARISLAAEEDSITEGLRRMGQAVHQRGAASERGAALEGDAASGDGAAPEHGAASDADTGVAVAAVAAGSGRTV